MRLAASSTLRALAAIAALGGGLIAWIRTATRMARGAGLEDVRLGIELCTVYWHYLLLVWLVLFALLLNT